MDTTIIVFKALLGAAFAILCVVVATVIAAWVVFAIRTIVNLIVNLIVNWSMRRRIKEVRWFLGRSGV